MLGRSRLLLAALLLVYGLLVWRHSANAQTGDAQPTRISAAIAAATATPTPDIFVRALREHMPVLRYDSGERFFPVRVESITNNVGNKLLRANGSTIDERKPGGEGLNIRYLRGTHKKVYPNGKEIHHDDKLDEKGNDADEHVGAQNIGKYGDRIYGRIVRRYDEDGRVTGAWLQYWFFYYFNDYPLADTGDHEGDWEMIQIKVDAKGVPHVAVYAHHTGASRCVWESIRGTGPNISRPIVFVARGTHASYPRAGERGLDEHNDGKEPRRIRSLIRLGSRTHQWLGWPGQWGSSDGSGAFGGPSPKGPRFQEGDKWLDPEAFYLSAKPDDDCIAPSDRRNR